MASEATLAPDMDIYLAMKQLLKRRLTGAPVVDENRVLIGMLTERDCLKVLVGGALDGLPGGNVSDYMTSPAESIGPIGGCLTSCTSSSPGPIENCRSWPRLDREEKRSPSIKLTVPL